MATVDALVSGRIALGKKTPQGRVSPSAENDHNTVHWHHEAVVGYPDVVLAYETGDEVVSGGCLRDC